MHWPPKQEDKGAWSALGGVLTVVMGTGAIAWAVAAAPAHSDLPALPAYVLGGLALVSLYFALTPLLGWPPWPRREDPLPPAGIAAGDAIRAGGDIEADGPIEAGHGVEAGGNIRSSALADPWLAATTKRKADLAALGLVNPLAGHFRIEQFASPLEHDEQGCVVRVVIAPDCRPAVGELRTDIKDTLKSALSTSSLETWGSTQIGVNQTITATPWLRSDPNSGQIATFKRYWGASIGGGFALWSRATLQLPQGYQFGPRVVFVLDVIERSAEKANQSPRLSMSLVQLHEFLHTLTATAIDEIGSTVLPLVCGETTPKILGPNYQINFGDRSLDTFVRIPDGFERPTDAPNIPWAEIRTSEDLDPRNLAARDTVIRDGLQKTLRSNGYDRIEDEIAKLPVPT